jgi:hypothetical protein
MRTLSRAIGIAALTAASVSCGSVVRDGTSAVYIVIDSLGGVRGAVTLGAAVNPLISDVLTNVTSPAPCTTTSPCPTIFGDVGQAVMHLALKNTGTTASPASISQFNAITIERYHVEYTRADGRNTPGVDVPYGFDGAVTVTISSSSPSTFGFLLVRSVAKEEAPLVQLRTSSQFLTVLAHVTFYGRDQTGNQATVAGTIQIEFANFGDF